MRLLYLSEEVPNRDPRFGDGSSMIPYEVIRNLPPHVRVSLVTFVGTASVPDCVRERCDDVTLLEPRAPLRSQAKSVVSSLSPGGAARVHKGARRAVADVSRSVDVSLVHGPHVIPLVRDIAGPVVVQTVDPWSRRLRMDAELARGVRRSYRALKARQAMSAEQAIPAHARLLTVGQADADAWSSALARPVRAIANGVSAPAVTWRPPEVPTVSFVGSLNYGPNVEGAQRLAHVVAPRLREHVPGLRVIIAGRRPTPEVLALASDFVEVWPDVDSVDDVFSRTSVAVFPDQRGLGFRNSVREAIACGVPVVASAVAAREQPAHPRLAVATDENALVTLALDALASASPRGADEGNAPAAAGRPWSVVAEEYLRECREAMRSRP
jgi:glycosyltransferase involved in cell wall biosynthesis